MVAPFGGKFRGHRAALRRIKAATWERAAAHSAEVMFARFSGPSRAREYLSGPVACRVCGARWTATVPAGPGRDLRGLECPRCGSPSGDLADDPDVDDGFSLVD